MKKQELKQQIDKLQVEYDAIPNKEKTVFDLDDGMKFQLLIAYVGYNVL